MKFCINKYAAGSILSNEISILLSFLSTDVTVENCVIKIIDFIYM